MLTASSMSIADRPSLAIPDHEVPLEVSKRHRLYTHSGQSHIGKNPESVAQCGQRVGVGEWF